MLKRVLFLVLVGACVAHDVAGDAINDSFITDGKTDTDGISDGSPEARAVLDLANTLTETQLRDDVELSSSAAQHIVSARQDQAFTTLADLDAVPYVGTIAFHRLLAYARAQGLVGDGGTTVGHGTLLDCNTSLGPDQQVTVIGDGETLTLRELTDTGATVTRTLGLSEWTSEKLRLRDDGFGSTSTLTKDGADWMLRSTGSGVDETGVADCWVDKSP
jgi:hypothetical protein